MADEHAIADELEGEVAAPATVVDAPPRTPFVKPHAPWRDVILLAALSALGSVGMDMYLPALPEIARTLHATPAQGQGTISIFLAGLAVGQVVYGPLSDRWGRRGPMLAGLLLYALGTLGCWLAQDIEVMTAARLLQAVGACGGNVIARAVVRDRYEDREVIHVFAMLSLVFTLAPILAPLIGGLVLTVAGWRWIFGIQLLFCAGTGLWALVSLRESRSEATRALAKSESPWRSYLALLKRPRLVGYLAVCGFAATSLFAYIGSAPEIVITLYRVPPEHFGWVFGANAIGMAAAGQINARLARTRETSTMLRWSLMVAVGLALLLLAGAWTGVGGLFGVLGPLFLVLSAFGFINLNASAAAMTIDRHRAGATAALLGSAFFGAGGLAGLAVATLHDGTARPMAYVILAGLLLAVIAMELTLKRERRLAALAV